jgi:phage terminase large subunit-like protein
VNLDIERISALANYFRANPTVGFYPSPALGAFMEDTSLRILVRAANRVGKTRHAAVKLSKLMLKYPNKRYRVVGVTYQQAIAVISKMLAEFLPPHVRAAGCNYKETTGWSHNLIRLTNGTVCQIKSNDQDAIAHAGDDLDGVWFDEPPVRDVWLEGVKRVMSKRGWVWVTLTPIGRPCGWLRSTVNAAGSGWVEYVAEFSHKNCPWYTVEQVNRWLSEASASPWAYRQTIFGDWEGEVVDRVFSGFTAECLVGEDELPMGEKFRVGIGIDHGEGVGKQIAVTILWTESSITVIDEVVNTESTVPEKDARAILKSLAYWDWNITNVQQITGDINSAGKMGAGLRVNDVLAAELAKQSKIRPGSVTVSAPAKGRGSVEHGEKLLNEAFLRGTLRVYEERCPVLAHALRNYSGEEDLKHAIDALRYICQPILESWSTGSAANFSKLKVR